MSSERPDEILSPLRAELDDLDAQIIDTLSRRIAVCQAVAESKVKHRIPMLQQQRIDSVKRRVRALAAEKGLREQFVENLYDLIIGETCRVELKIIDALEKETSAVIREHSIDPFSNFESSESD